jgi:DNA-binding NarL/FixJ family response regulator
MEFARKTIIIFESGRSVTRAKLMASISDSDIAGSLMIREGETSFLNLLRRIPEVLLVTPCLCGKSAVESARILKKRSPEAQIIVLYQVDADAQEGTVSGGEDAPLPMADAQANVRDFQGRSIYKDLTAREKQVIHSLASGKRYLEVAGQFGISFETVKSHIKNICRKLGARNRTEAIAIYYNFISLPDTGLDLRGPMVGRDLELAPVG